MEANATGSTKRLATRRRVPWPVRLVLAILAIVLFGIPNVVQAATLTATWNANPESNIAGYRLSYGTQSATYTVVLDVGNVTSRQLSLPGPQRYYFAVRAYNTSGLISGYSTEVFFDVPAGPALTSLSPTSGSVGTPVTITGTNFGATKGTSTVVFNGMTAAPTSWSATSIVVPVPAGAITGNVVVTVGGIASNGLTFTVTTAPTLTSLSPASGVVGTSVTILGTNFGATKGTSTVRFNGVTGTPTSWSATNIVVPVPAGATTGNVVVTVGGVASNALTFTNTAGADLVFTFGASGTWLLMDGSTYSQLHALSPEMVATGDVDGNGKDEIILDFGPSSGVWVRMNSTSWMQLHTLSPTAMTIGDLDANGRDDVVLSFAGSGIWVWLNGSTWQQMNGQSCTRMVTGNLDGQAGDEVIIDFPGQGLWVFANYSSWQQLHPTNSSGMITGDFDGNGRDDLIINFSGQGIWNYQNGTAWVQVHGQNAVNLAVGDYEGNGRDDLVVDFGPSGIWMVRDSGAWWQLHGATSEGITMADLDGSGIADIVIDFGPALGTWILSNGTTWFQTYQGSPGAVVAGKFN